MNMWKHKRLLGDAAATLASVRWSGSWYGPAPKKRKASAAGRQLAAARWAPWTKKYRHELSAWDAKVRAHGQKEKQ